MFKGRFQKCDLVIILPGSTINHWLAEFHCILSESKKIISKNNDLVTSLLFMKTNEELARSELVGVHNVQCLIQMTYLDVRSRTTNQNEHKYFISVGFEFVM